MRRRWQPAFHLIVNNLKSQLRYPCSLSVFQKDPASCPTVSRTLSSRTPEPWLHQWLRWRLCVSLMCRIRTTSGPCSWPSGAKLFSCNALGAKASLGPSASDYRFLATQGAAYGTTRCISTSSDSPQLLQGPVSSG